ncbi:hypothetical protein NQ317_003598 [Molorchus minor]|uniref:Uncharacterized protein n=1 Tax=Molorchus minor TaxID=1323400 RepID=A0ABQ9JB21_9CUCU|nr:hypothetical protein NQ317_003598 [Molorchus minor]
MDMVNYLILTHNFYTGQQLKAYKSLQAYKYYEAGFVKVLAKKVHENAFVVGKGSQKSELHPFLLFWNNPQRHKIMAS